MNIEDDVIEKSIRTQIAGKLLESLTPESRDALLTKSIEAALKEWSFKHAIEEVVAERARVLAAEMVRQDRWTIQIRAAINDAFEAFLASVVKSLPAALAEMMAGVDGTGYSARSGILLKHLQGKA